MRTVWGMIAALCLIAVPAQATDNGPKPDERSPCVKKHIGCGSVETKNLNGRTSTAAALGAAADTRLTNEPLNLSLNVVTASFDEVAVGGGFFGRLHQSEDLTAHIGLLGSTNGSEYTLGLGGTIGFKSPF